MGEWISGATVNGTATTADGSLTFSEDNIQVWGSAVRRLVIALTGTNMTLANVTRVTVKAKSQLRIDAPPNHIRAWLGAMSKKAEWPTAATRFTIPLDMFLGLGADPAGKLRVEIAKNATPGASTAQMHEYVDDETPVKAYGNFLSTSQSLIGVSAVTQPCSLSGEGILLGLTVPDVANVTMIRVKKGKKTLAEFMSSAAIIESNELQRGTTAVTEVYLPLPAIDLDADTLIQVSTNGSYTPGEWGMHTINQYAQ